MKKNKKKPPKPKNKQVRAICSAFYAVVINGRRYIIYHNSGEVLKGELA